MGLGFETAFPFDDEPEMIMSDDKEVVAWTTVQQGEELGRVSPEGKVTLRWDAVERAGIAFDSGDKNIVTCFAKLLLEARTQIAERDARIKELEQGVALCMGRYEHWFKEATKARGDLAATRAQQVPEGWQLVPKEPTNAMLHELAAEWDSCGNRTMEFNYRSMLDVTPKPPDINKPIDTED